MVQLQKKIGNKLNLEKCHLWRAKVQYLGHEISKDGIGMIPEYVEKILKWTLPKKGKDLMSFLGFCGYYQRSIVKYGRLTAGLQELKTQEGDLKWTIKLRADFEDLKQCFSEYPVRSFPRYDLKEPFLLDCDFSAINMAAVLSQVQDGTERLIGCVAKKCSKAESAYSSFKGEMSAVILGLRKFEHILRCKHFIIRTDSMSVVSLKRMPDPRGIFVRWQSFLDGFDYSFQHRPGKKSQNADSLSRMPGLEAEGPENQDPYGVDQDLIDEIYSVSVVERCEISDNAYRMYLQEDKVLQEAIKWVKKGEYPGREERKKMSSTLKCYIRLFPLLMVDDGKLYLRNQERGTRETRNTWIRLCPPKGMYDQIFQHCHKGRLAAHSGRDETVRVISERFYWPCLRSYVDYRVANCVSCLKKYSHPDKPKHQMYTQQLGRFGEKIFVDCVGPFTACEYQGQQMKHIVTILDGYSRYLVCVPVADLTSESVGKAILENWVFRFGLPENLHSDNGTCFVAKAWLDCLAQLGISATQTPPYTPQSNRVERHHQTLLQTIRTNISHSPGEWCQKLEVCAFAHNIRVNSITGLSPFYVLHGFAPRLPVDAMFPELRSESDDAVDRIFSGFDRVWKMICTNQEKYALMIRTNRGIPKIEVGDTVYYFNSLKKGQKQALKDGRDPKLSHKLQASYVGPFKVQRKISDQLIEIFPEKDWAVKKKSIVTLVNKVRKIESGVDTPSEFDLEDLNSDLLEEEILISPYNEEVVDEIDQGKDVIGLDCTEKEIEDEIFNGSYENALEN